MTDETVTAFGYFIRTLSTGLDETFKGTPDEALSWGRKTVRESRNRGCHVTLPGKLVTRDKAGRVVVKRSAF